MVIVIDSCAGNVMIRLDSCEFKILKNNKWVEFEEHDAFSLLPVKDGMVRLYEFRNLNSNKTFSCDPNECNEKPKNLLPRYGMPIATCDATNSSKAVYHQKFEFKKYKKMLIARKNRCKFFN